MVAVEIVEEPTGVNDPVDLPPFHRDGVERVMRPGRKP